MSFKAMETGKSVSENIHLEGTMTDQRQPNKLDSNDNEIAAVSQTEHVVSYQGQSPHDKEAQLPRDDDDPIAVTPEDNARVLRKIDLRILPLILFVYCLQSLDKTTLSYASVFGLIEDTHLVGDQFSWLGSVVYVAQLAFQPLVAYSLVKFPMGKFSGVMVFCWGAVLCGMTAATSFAGLMAARLLLGMFEASVAPTFIAVVQMWYRRSEQTARNASWYAMLGIVNMVGSLLSYGLGHIDSKLRPYQIIFLFCGLLTVVFSFVMLVFMPDSPQKAKFLTTEEKEIAIERLRMNQMGMGTGEWKWDHVRECALDIKTWLWFSLIILISIPSGGISTFGPLIIESFGFDSFKTILFYMPFGAVQMIATLGGAWLADKIKMKSPVLLLLCLPPIAGCSVLLATGRDPSDRAVLLTGYYIISFYPGITPLIYSWSGQNTAGDTKRKVTTACIFIGSSTGNIIGPLLFRTSEKPRYDRGLKANLVLFIVLAIFILAGMLLIKILNRRQAAKRKALGKPEHIQDLSMMDGKAIKDTDGALNKVEDNTGQGALEDITDLKNEDFIYVY
ncbi:major facilitator superfamily domain-containing protein [Dactylonectria estremocensis]|uniref:Major facilitator superfamily domain-containing protein n=1 Tax=Dactylonectria estremocensis TaxID=1079267 RepID=A0A9P9DZJ0_9HYPO|nr:major facilitator superfamily domain-containing protein [Dactylonectria estremocensis]